MIRFQTPRPSVFTLVADLHMTQWRQRHSDPSIAEWMAEGLAGTDVLLLAGDLSTQGVQTLPQEFDALRRLLPKAHILFFPGNHEHRHSPLNPEPYIAICQNHNVLWAQDQTLTLSSEDTVHTWTLSPNTQPGPQGQKRWICATLWTDFAKTLSDPEAMAEVERLMIQKGHRDTQTPPRPLAGMPQRHKAHLDGILAALKNPFTGQTTVVTHHPPRRDVMLWDEGHESLFSFSDLATTIETLLPKNGDVWAFGHVHQALLPQDSRWIWENIAFGNPREVSQPAQKLKSFQKRFC